MIAQNLTLIPGVYMQIPGLVNVVGEEMDEKRQSYNKRMQKLNLKGIQK